MKLIFFVFLKILDCVNLDVVVISLNRTLLPTHLKCQILTNVIKALVTDEDHFTI